MHDTTCVPKADDILININTYKVPSGCVGYTSCETQALHNMKDQAHYKCIESQADMLNG